MIALAGPRTATSPFACSGRSTTTVGRELDEPLDLAIGAVEVHGLAVAARRLRDGKESEQLEVLVHAVGREVGVDGAELTLRQFRVAAVDDALVRLAPRPEAHRARPGEGPHRRVLGGGGEHVGELLTTGAHPLEAVAVGRRTARMAEKSGGSVERLVTRSVQNRCTLPMWRVRSSTVQPGHDGTGASRPASSAASPRRSMFDRIVAT